MRLIDKHPPGSFCWIELGTTDQNAAKAFYSSVFGWTVNDFPMGQGSYYSMFQIDGKDVAAAYTLGKDQQTQGIPPHWLLYVATESADKTAGSVDSVGGKLLAAPFDVFDVGRMAMVQDPTGAVFAIWEPKRHKGTGIAEANGTLCWADLSTPDPAKATSFYSSLFGWRFEPGHDASGYLHIRNGEQFIGGVPPISQRDSKTPPHWLPYFATSDCDETAGKGEKSGATFLLPPMTMEGVGRMAVLKDPQGAVFAIFQEMARGK
jgi:predicted enzyme related to lactoylglutathione lyase